MGILITENLRETIRDKYLYLDTNFLLFTFKNESISEEVATLLSESYPIIDPNIKFEFLRGVYIPEELDSREKFLNSDNLILAPDHQQIYRETIDRALILSQLYRLHTKKGNQKQENPDKADLLLAAKLIASPKTSLILTANLKHFKKSLFDTVGYISSKLENEHFGVLKINIENTNREYEKLKKLRS